MKLQVILMTALLVTLGAGCKPESETRPAGVSAGSTETATFLNLRELDVISGKYVVKLSGRGSLELLGGGTAIGKSTKAPHTVEWDTTAAPDGVTEVEVRSGASSAKRKVVVLNNGAEVFFKNGSGGKVVVPPTGYQHQHLRYHFDMTDAVKRIVAVLTWEEPGFDLELALGLGTCPHHGKQVAAVRSTTSPIVAHHGMPAGETAPQGQWFAHVRLMNADKVVGKETPFSIKAFLLK